ncbi:hypothetical protein ARMSODRAFT_1023975 [Armillaria solidipes]|uniref:Uncharacterized protein n=1 Tax=Armillaria solidipes TaxID=1076256 RepID=A0A2H3B911_9AGAR|nr:hypothetical protein ARMSODRAFT_1023975 [Armillaria solidipes]
MQNVTAIIHWGIFKAYSIDTDGDIDPALDLSVSLGKFHQHIFRQENCQTPLKLTHPQSGHEARRHRKSFEGRLRDVEDHMKAVIASQREFQTFQERIRREENRLREEQKSSALHYGTMDRFSRGIIDNLLSTNPGLERYVLLLSQAICEVSVGLGRPMAYLPNVLVAWYYHRAIFSSASDPPYPTLSQQLPSFLHQKNIAAANVLDHVISGSFDLGPLTGFVLAHIEKVSLLVDTWILRSILGKRGNKDGLRQLIMVPRADFAWEILLEQNRLNSSHKNLIQEIMPSLIDVLTRSGRIKYFAS